MYIHLVHAVVHAIVLLYIMTICTCMYNCMYEHCVPLSLACDHTLFVFVSALPQV